MRPNCSLSPAGRRGFLFLIAIVTFAIALAFAWAGAWLVLPFAGLELGVLVWAFRELDRHAADYEVISIRGDTVAVERRVGSRVTRHEFNRYWVRLVLKRDAAGELALCLRSHGREVVLGRCLAAQARAALAQELRNHFNN
ncbi:DUF2244 domain-containing protein [Thiobacter aerophilum]|uniref:DUF2244 domain-containing protein n=1 Tax=Thiobacter aerophilum TaxID=3121275 RepID=A0ABV0EGN1_9BURK